GTAESGGNKARVEGNGPEFTTSGAQQGCGDFKPLGDPSGLGSSLDHGTTSPGDLTSTQYGTTRALGDVAAIARASSDSSTMWVATSTGRVFVTQNADAANPADVTFTRIDSLLSNSPGRCVSGTAIAPKNPLRAYISYSGYNSNTPNQPGHVFVATYSPSSGTAIWTNLDNGTGPLGDLPVTGIIYDPKAQVVYASTDFGVLVQANVRSSFWQPAANGMPQVEVAGISFDPTNRVLYAATHGRGSWSLKLPAAGAGPFAGDGPARTTRD